MENTTDWITSICAVGSLIVSIIALIKTGTTASTVKSLSSQVNTNTSKVENISADVIKISSSMKNSKIKQENSGGSNNTFVGGNNNG